MKKILLFLLFTFIIGACGQQEDLLMKQEDKKQEGIIVIKKVRDGKNNIVLLIPDIDQEDTKDKTEEELLKMAQNKNGAYYFVENEDYNKLNVGDLVEIYWNGNENDSNPPQREAEKVEISLN